MAEMEGFELAALFAPPIICYHFVHIYPPDELYLRLFTRFNIAQREKIRENNVL